MQQIDFLPQEYRHRHRRRQNQAHTVALAGLAALGLLAIELIQQGRYWQLGKALADCQPAHENAVRLQEALAQLQQNLQTAECDARLFAYLHHPWPRTQIVSALLLSLPPEIALDELQIDRLAGVKQGVLASFATENEKEKVQAGPASAADLKQLHQRYGSRQTVVLLVGKTTDLAALHHYLAQLGEQDLFTAAELESVESEDQQGTMTRFRARVTVRPGYGQKGGPTAPLFFVNCQPELFGGQQLHVAGTTNFPDGARLQIRVYRLLDTAEQLPGTEPHNRRLLGWQTAMVQSGRFEANLPLSEPVAAGNMPQGTTARNFPVEQTTASLSPVEEHAAAPSAETVLAESALATTQVVVCVAFSPHDQQPSAVLERTGPDGELLRGHGVRKTPSLTVFEVWQPIPPPSTPAQGDALASNPRQ